MTSLTWLEFQFSSAHLYHQALWTVAKNHATFGRCFTKHGHGHNYRAEVAFEIENTPHNELEIQNLQKQVGVVIQQLDHEHLNFVIPEFKTKIPTTENIALYIAEKINSLSLKWPLKKVKLNEMDDLWVELSL